MPNYIWAIILIIILLAVIPNWPYSRGWGWGPSGALGVLLIILLVLLIAGVL
jgi:hypothetical protein